jgi:HD-GYP domain-containing protein (c-di-GMP phosphodiesterase class II)
LADSWFSIGSVLVLAALAPGPLALEFVEIYVLAFAAHFAMDLGWTLLRNALLDRLPTKRVLADYVGTAQVDVILSPLAFVVSLTATKAPIALLTLAPLAWMMQLFSRERQERYSAALELQRAYRGTVMLLTDVVEFEDRYTADHSRSVVDLVHAVADELNIGPEGRQELEFAALLHDVGKIAIGKQVLNKPSSLSREEFELIKTHTIEGQFMLDRVGGLLARVGEIVRSCHERWDGSGYPDGLAGEEIPLAARIVFVCDAYNAMTSHRPYRAARGSEVALRELTRHAGTQFDPGVVSALITVVEQGEPTLAPVDEVRAVLAGSPIASGASAPA